MPRGRRPSWRRNAMCWCPRHSRRQSTCTTRRGSRRRSLQRVPTARRRPRPRRFSSPTAASCSPTCSSTPAVSPSLTSSGLRTSRMFPSVASPAAGRSAASKGSWTFCRTMASTSRTSDTRWGRARRSATSCTVGSRIPCVRGWTRRLRQHSTRTARTAWQRSSTLSGKCKAHTPTQDSRFESTVHDLTAGFMISEESSRFSGGGGEHFLWMVRAFRGGGGCVRCRQRFEALVA
mmetsp:Transcript_39833/g.81553  ORF Transcript_39833/g.81553 Transcript_39833/m.81553 type:complete len:234 (+) Transcript_39833:1054-1755(+)